MTNFHQTPMGLEFYDGNIPRIAKALERIAKALEKTTEEEPMPRHCADSGKFDRILFTRGSRRRRLQTM